MRSTADRCVPWAVGRTRSGFCILNLEFTGVSQFSTAASRRCRGKGIAFQGPQKPQLAGAERWIATCRTGAQPRTPASPDVTSQEGRRLQRPVPALLVVACS